MNYDILKAQIAQVVKANGAQEITGDNLQAELFRTIDALGVGYTYIGLLAPGYTPGAIDARVFGIATTAGTYAGLTVPTDGIYILRYDTAWTMETIWAKTYDDATLAEVIRKVQTPFFVSAYLPSLWATPALPVGATKLAPPLTIKASYGISLTTGGGAYYFQYDGAIPISLSFVLIGGLTSSTNAVEYSIRIYRNGAAEPGLASLDRLAKTTEADNTVCIGDVFNVQPGDLFEIYLYTNTAATYTFHDIYFSVRER